MSLAELELARDSEASSVEFEGRAVFGQFIEFAQRRSMTFEFKVNFEDPLDSARHHAFTTGILGAFPDVSEIRYVGDDKETSLSYLEIRSDLGLRKLVRLGEDGEPIAVEYTGVCVHAEDKSSELSPSVAA